MANPSAISEQKEKMTVSRFLTEYNIFEYSFWPYTATVVFWYEIRNFLYIFFFVFNGSNKPKIIYEQLKSFVFHQKSSKNQNLTL